MNVDKWVEDRLAALDDGSEWQPEAALARARLRDLDRKARTRRRWAWATAVAACLGMMAFVQPRACANPRGCSQTATQRAVPPAVTVRNYKESGSPSAPIVLEVYSDYECPSCAVFYRDTMPLLVTGYVQTGKIRLLHRDFPLPQHSYAKLAARYANAAGQAGQYDLVVTRLFETQAVWGVSGDIEAELAPVLPETALRQVRELVKDGQRLDDTVVADQAMGANDHIHATPTLVVVWKGSRQAISPIPSFTLLKSYLDHLLGQQ
jgi:protein-disulfide isomerase